ncbi:hypothetical protein LMH87_011056 [Akanthomyces muscarius]|uniref:UPF3 domain-containing protein n=1 Tax=Akanthomyces muscarius TaxID=2231603 RepID=A0A9W8QAK0_AKAMU|nr:hypothetical protein LMH87_011056 [Akanthomyces muscarius]KAJ4150302.1 hypothetical protein LMH87_011056 [Akanthomyces muscarius]
MLNHPSVYKKGINIALTNGAAANAASQGNEPGKGKGGREGGSSRPKKRRGQGDKKIDNSKGRETEAPRPPRQRQQNDGGKLILRRLPPGMTEAECVAILGETWAVGRGKVDWFSFIAGKISTDPSKPSRPARAYIHLIKKDDMLALTLVGPPSLELSAYKKVPSNKKRTDTRQGTIDQDPEFMAFLEGLANPAPLRDGADMDDGDDANKGESKVTTTPLVEYLKEKKANKSKDSSSSKKRGEGKNKGSKEDEPSKKKGRESRAEKADKAEKGSKTTVKILTKKAATEQAADAAKNAAKAINAAIAQDAPKSKRAGIATAARILQRDLGLSPGSAHRRARQDAAKAEAKSKEETPIEQAQEASQSAETGNSQEGKAKTNGTAGKPQIGRRGRDARNGEKPASATEASSQPTAPKPPVILKKRPEGQAITPSSPAAVPSASANQQIANTKGVAEKNPKLAATNSKAGQSQKKLQSVTADATKAFVKHAVHSQGVTEAALRQALEPLGTIIAIEMDKRKAFAYVDFSDHAGLVKAVAASPLAVAQGSVQILERKDKKPATGNPGTGVGTTAPSAAADKDKAKDGEKEKEKGETRRGRRGRGGKGNNGGGASTTPASTASGAQAASGGPVPASSG